MSENVQYVEKITMEEYNRQKDEYTQQALKHLQEQMQEHNYKQIQYDSLEKDDDSEQSSETNSVIEYDSLDCTDDNIQNSSANINLIIKHITSQSTKQSSTGKNLRQKRKKNSEIEDEKSSIHDVIYAQREIDMKTIQKLKEVINNLKHELEDESRKVHFLKLDLNNACCDNCDLKKEIIILKENNAKQNKQIVEYKKKVYQDNIYMMVMNIIIGLLVFLVFLY